MMPLSDQERRELEGMTDDELVRLMRRTMTKIVADLNMSAAFSTNEDMRKRLFKVRDGIVESQGLVTRIYGKE